LRAAARQRKTLGILFTTHPDFVSDKDIECIAVIFDRVSADERRR
jgi:hypothetical protein